ncbi:MAG: acyltransferase family protein [Myxococcaceae bacterium]|nr:acyltransferase family protein [Myxococcaceae bacterium]
MTARFDGLDRVRAAAMLLGLVYHATYAFMPDVGQWYPVQADATWSGFSVIAGVVHAVRMPVFFTLSGFFAALVMDRRGDRFLVDRFKRLMVPFLVAVPLNLGLDVLIRRASLAQGTVDPGYAGQGEWLFRPLHLWFLEYLFLYCLAAWALVATPLSVRVGGLLKRPEVVLLASALTAGTVVVWGEPQPAFSFVPSVGAVAYFAPFFAFGWALYRAREETAVLQRRGWWMVVASLALCLFVFTRPLQWQWQGQALAAVAAWLMVLGVLGPAMKPGTRPAGPLVQSAYWVYLLHHPLVQGGQVLVAKQAWPAWVGYLVVVAGAFAVSFGSFWLVVRRTPLAPWVGAKRV